MGCPHGFHFAEDCLACTGQGSYEPDAEDVQTSAELKRARLIAVPEDGDPVDVTEAVVTLLDLVEQSYDWASGFRPVETSPAYDQLKARR